MPSRVVRSSPLSVADKIVGRPLAAPWRRATALLLDLTLLLVPTLAVALGIALAVLRLEDPGGYRALTSVVTGAPDDEVERHEVTADLAHLLARIDAPGLPPRIAVAIEEGDRETAARLLAEKNVLIAMNLGGTSRQPDADTVLLDLEELIPRPVRGISVFLVPALYFTLLTRGRRATIGKRLLRIRVTRLDGRPLGLLESLERFGSYFAVAGTIGIGLLDLWRDPNRRLSHDRVAGTVVLLLPKAPKGAG